MFVPRALRSKGVRERDRNKSERPIKKARAEAATAESKSSDAAPVPGQSNTDTNLKKPAPKLSTTTTVTPEYLSYLVCGIELLFTDYAHQDETTSQWLQAHYREVEGESKFIHLSAILEHQYISLLRPAATQVLVQQALREQPSAYLELSQNGYFVRRRPSTYPLAFIPSNSFDITDDTGLSYWDQRTIYVEPHARDLCKTPARVAHWLKEHGGMREKWLPIQAVHTLYNSCAFVVLSGNVTHEGTWLKWRKAERPEHWKILTKVEHSKRTQEYLDLLAKEKRERAPKVDKPPIKPNKRKRKKYRAKKKRVESEEELVASETEEP